MELCVRWAALAVRESRASNASCLGLLLDYISSMILLTNVCTPQHAPHAPPPSNALLTSPGAEVQPPARSLASRCSRHCQIVHPRHTLTPSSAGITSALRDRLHGHTAMTTEGWSSVRQLILLRTKRKAAEAALNSFMLTTADCSQGQPQQQSAPLSTLVLNCFVGVIGQQVQPAVNPRPKHPFRRAVKSNAHSALAQEFFPSMMSIALQQFYSMLLYMQVSMATVLAPHQNSALCSTWLPFNAL
jgi:hypothetical protein